MSFVTRLRTLYRRLTDLPGEEEWREVTARLDATVAANDAGGFVARPKRQEPEAKPAEPFAISRSMLLMEVARALRLHGELGEDIVRELEKRLLHDGRFTPTWDKGNYDRDALMGIHEHYWFSQDPRATHIQDLGSTHLIHTIKMIQNGARKNGESVPITPNMKAKLPALLRELAWRGLSLADLDS